MLCLCPALKPEEDHAILHLRMLRHACGAGAPAPWSESRMSVGWVNAANNTTEVHDDTD